MAANWDFYFCRINGELASIFLNLEFDIDVPDPTRPILGWVWVDMNAPRFDGLSSDEEAPTLHQIEDALRGSLGNLGGLFVGRTTTAGRRELYYYLPSKEGFYEAVNRALFRFDNYRISADTQQDLDWTHYLDHLYPDNAAIQTIRNRSALQSLTARGDDLVKSRKVTHYLYFDTDSPRQKLAQWARKAGYIAFAFPANSQSEQKAFGLSLAHQAFVDQESIDRVTTEIYEKALNLSGEYDRWESEVLRGPIPR
jgi:hypothetical protein